MVYCNWRILYRLKPCKLFWADLLKINRNENEKLDEKQRKSLANNANNIQSTPSGKALE